MTRIGFIGTGTIAQAVIEGLSLGDLESQIVVSPRSEERSRALAARFPEVTRAGSNGEVAASADIVCLSMLPGRVEEALSGLSFSPHQTVVSFVAGLDLAVLREMVPVGRLCRVLPLPSIARRTGPILCYPILPHVAALLGPLGNLILPADETEFEALMVVSGFMSTYFALESALREWLEARGADRMRSSLYVRSMFAALGATGLAAGPGEVDSLPDEHETQGGLNFRTRRQLAEAGWFSAPGSAFDDLLSIKHSGLE